MHSRETTPARLRALGRAVKAARLALHLSQEALAERCDLHPTYISRIEGGRVNVSFENIDRIARALRLRPSLLFDRANL